MNDSSQPNIWSSPFSIEFWPRWESIGQLSRRIGWTEDDGELFAEAFADFAPAMRVLCTLADRGLTPSDIQTRFDAARSMIDVDIDDRYILAARTIIELVAAYIAESTNANLADWHFLNLAALAYLPPTIDAALLPTAALTIDSPALKPFFDLGLLKGDDSSLAFNPLLQHAVRSRLTARQNFYGFIVALAGVERAFKLEASKAATNDGWSMLGAAYAVVGHASELAAQLPPKTLETAADFAFDIARDQQERRAYGAARELTKLGIALQDRIAGAVDDKIGVSYSNFANLLKKSGDLSGAQEALRRSIEIGEAVHGVDHPKIGLRLAKLGGVLMELHDHEGARDAYLRSVEIGEATLEAESIEFEFDSEDAPTPTLTLIADIYGEHSFEIVDDLKIYAGLLQSFDDDTVSASRCHMLADRLEADEYRATADQIEEIAELLFSYSLFFRREGHLSDARRLLERVVAIRDGLPHVDDIKLGRTVAAYLMLLQQIGDVDAIRSAAARLTALRPAVDRNLAGVTIPTASSNCAPFSKDGTTSASVLATRYERLGAVDRELGNVDAVVRHLGRAVDLTEREGRPGKNLTHRLDLLATAFRQLGSLDAACAAYERAAGIGERIDPTGPKQANRLEQLAALRKLSGDFHGAISSLMKAAAVDAASGRTNTKTGTIRLNNLARALEAAGDLRQAEAVYERALRAAAYDSRDLPLRTVLNNYALMLRHKGDLATAAWYAKRMIDLDKSTGRPPDAGTANRLANAAIILYDHSEYNLAGSAFDDASAIRVTLFGEDDETAKTLRERFAKARAMASAASGATMS